MAYRKIEFTHDQIHCVAGMFYRLSNDRDGTVHECAALLPLIKIMVAGVDDGVWELETVTYDV